MKMKNEPKNILEAATILGDIVLTAFLDIIFSPAQNNVAIRIKLSPKLNKLPGSNFSNNTLPIKITKIPAINNLFNFSFKNITAIIATNKNMLLWIIDALPEVDSDKPLKNNRNGILPPTKPIIAKVNQSFFLSNFTLCHSLKAIIIAKTNRPAIKFFKKV